MSKNKQFLTRNLHCKPHHKLFFTLAILFLTLFFIPIVSAQLNFDNIKSYDEETGDYGKIVIKDWFGIQKLYEAELKENTDYCSERCYAEKQIILYQTSTLIDDVRFETLNDDGTRTIEPIRSYKFYIQTGTEQVEIDDYEIQCSGKVNENGDEICPKVKVGSHYETEPIWEEYILGTELEPGTYNVKLVGDKKPSKSVDWIIRSQGSWFQEWAEWNSEQLQFNTHDQTFNNFPSTSDLMTGVAAIMNRNATLRNVTIDSASGCDTVFLANSSNGAVLAESTMAGNNASFNYNLTEGVTYDFVCNLSTTASHTQAQVTSASFPYTNDSLNFTTAVFYNPSRSTVGTVILQVLGITVAFDAGSIVTLESPADNSGIGLTGEFNCSVDVIGATATNISLWTNDSGTFTVSNTTTGLSGASEGTIINYTFSGDGNYLWTCEGCDSDGDCGLALENRTVAVDSTAPLITINAPVNTLDYNSLGGNETLNWSIVELNVDTLQYNYNGTNITVFGLNNITNFTLEDNNFNLTFYANDTLGNENSSFVSWDYNVFENNRTFNGETTEGGSEIFSLNFTKSSTKQISTINLIHNSTSYSSQFVVSDNQVIASNTITIPATAESITVPFFWSITLNDGTNINTTSSDQTINIIQLGNCTTFDQLIYNYTIFDEELQTRLENSTIEISLEMYDSTQTTQLLNFSQSYDNINEASICMNGTLLTTVNYSADSVVKYFSNETNGSTSTNYAVEYYNILNEVITNTTIPKNIKLYDLKEDDSTEFQLTFRDEALALAPNILVQVHRQYVADGDFKIVEIPITDSSGQTVLHLVRNDVVYNLVMVNSDREIIATFNSITAFCQDFTIGECSIKLNVPQDPDEVFNLTDDLSITSTSPVFSNLTNLVSFDFTSNNLSSVTVSTTIIKESPFGNRTVCTNALTSSSGTLNCNVSSVVDTDRYLFVEIYVNGDLKTTETIDLGADGFNFGIVNGAFYAFLMILFIITLFMEDKQMLIVSLGIGWAAILAMAMIKGALFGFFSGGIWLMISIFIMLWKLNKEKTI